MNQLTNLNGKNYIFLGPPGVGKGTLAQLMSNRHHLKHISTGDIFRQAIKAQSELGKKVEQIVETGAYVPDQITNELVKQTLNDWQVKQQGFILDGYPRTLNQANFLEKAGIKIDQVILLNAPMEIVLKRLMARKRADDNPEIIKDRIEVYNQKTKPLIDFYHAKGSLLNVDVSGKIEQNYHELLTKLSKNISQNI